MMSRRITVAAIMTALAAVSLAPAAAADPTADLRSAVAAKRGGCPALQSDPVLEGVAQRANIETQNYANRTARFQPMEDPMPMLRQLSYPAGKAKLLAGFASAQKFPDAEQKAIYGAALFGWDTIPDCTYTRYGADVRTDTNTGNSTAAIVLAGD
ncbi:hypothetical protein NLX62_00835 [Mycobacteriaceae bacterium Msp059]|jgi:hypothetical protein|nr:hypothetical protein [Mycobacteriaceae bacterium Msp059]